MHFDVGSNVVSRDEDSVSTSAMRERYASLLAVPNNWVLIVRSRS